MQSILVLFTRKSERNSSEVSCSGPATVKANGARTFREIPSSPEDVSVPIASHLFADPFFFLSESTYSKCIQTWQGQGLDWRSGNALLKKKKKSKTFLFIGCERNETEVSVASRCRWSAVLVFIRPLWTKSSGTLELYAKCFLFKIQKKQSVWNCWPWVVGSLLEF